MRSPGAPKEPEASETAEPAEQAGVRAGWWPRLRHVLLSGPFVLASIFIAIGVIVAAVLVLVQTPYALEMPGPATEVQHLIAPDPHPSKGALYLVTIYSEPANLAEWLYAKVNPEADLVPREQARPKNISEQDYQTMLGHMMDESKVAAKVVAFRAAGYNVTLNGQGAQIQSITDNSKAKGILKEGDIVVAADAQPVTTANDLTALILAHKPGDVLPLEVKRGQETLTVKVPLIEAPDEPGRARIGIAVLTYHFDYKFPESVDISTHDIGGPSAGLMFALGIYNALTDTDITHGHKIAGTGTISTDGKVGAIGGAKYKVVSAEGVGAELFLVPTDNYEEAKKAAKTIKVVPVATFDDALKALANLPTKS